MKILVTGATGYIGAHVVASLAIHGHTVDGTDINMSQNDIARFTRKLITRDLCDFYGWQGLDYDVVVHLGGVTKVGPSMANPALYYETNTLGTDSLLKWCTNGEHFIYCSTGAAFNPTASPYAMSKRAAEDIVRNHNQHSILRFYNVGGNDGFHKFDDSYSHLIRKAAMVANGLHDKLTIFGTDYRTRDGTAIRNYSHIKDIVNAVLTVVRHGPTRSVECLGTTTGHTVKEVIDAMKKVSGKDFTVEYGPSRPGDIEISTLPYQSSCFIEEHTLEQQCESALRYERGPMW